MADAPWREKAKRLIAAFARQAYERENRLPNGKLCKIYRPYALPEVAEELVRCLDTNDEERAKSIFVHSYEVEKLKVE